MLECGVRLQRCHIYASPKKKHTFFSLSVDFCAHVHIELPIRRAFVLGCRYRAAVDAVDAYIDAVVHSFARTIIFQLFQIHTDTLTFIFHKYI